jgi:uncharacterized phage protein (predicted DNA packaging)
MAYITLNEAKKHCNIDEDFVDDDIYLTGLIDMAEAVVANHIHDTLADLEVDGKLPLPLIHGIKLMIGNFYENREPVLVGTISAALPYSFEYLLDTYTNRTIS